MKVYPAPGLLVRDPVSKTHVPADGLEVSDGDFFWNRLLRDGDVTLTPPAATTEAVVTDAVHDKDI
jgi:hypothetical protein